MTRISEALNIEPVASATAGGLGALPFALSDVGWVLIALSLMLVVVVTLSVLGRRRRRRALALSAVQRGTSSP